MEKNQKMLLFCAFQIGIYLLFLSFLLVYLKIHRSEIQNGALMLLWITMIFLVLAGCAITLAIIEVSNPHFKWGFNFYPSRVYYWFRQRRGFAAPLLLVAR